MRGWYEEGDKTRLCHSPYISQLLLNLHVTYGHQSEEVRAVVDQHISKIFVSSILKKSSDRSMLDGSNILLVVPT